MCRYSVLGAEALSCCLGQGPQSLVCPLSMLEAATCSDFPVICLQIHVSLLGPCRGWDLNARMACDDLCQTIMCHDLC